MKWHILLAGLVWMSASVAVSAQTTQPSAEAKLVAELYGKRIAKARASAKPDDDVALAREILLAAADSVNPTSLRYLLAMEALKLSASVGSEDATKLATESLNLADQLKPLEPVEKCRFEVKIAARRYEFARKNRVPTQARTVLAEDMVDAEIALAEALMQVRQTKQAGVVLASARSKAGKYKLLDQLESAKAATKALQALIARLARIRVLESRLERALKGNDAETVRTSRQNLALIYLLDEGDISKSGSYISGTGHKYESSTLAAMVFLKDPEKIPAPDVCNEAIKNLIHAARSAKNEQARIRIATTAMNLCRALQAGKLTGLAAAKTRLLLAEAEKLAGTGPADRFIRLLKTNYKGLDGKIEILNLKKKLVRVTYDFSRRKQLGDWRTGRGAWTVSRKKGAVIGTPADDNWAFLTNRLCFRADNPLLVTFRVRGQRDLTGAIGFSPGNAPQRRCHWLHCRLGAYSDFTSNHISYLYDGGRRVWSDRRYKVARNTTYRFRLAWDGKGTFTWSVNGKVFCKHKALYAKKDLPFTSLFVRLEVARKPAGFDDVIIEGVVLEDPNQRFKIPERRRRHRPDHRRHRP
ncbi:MAG: hypothetical protein KAV00_02700 [Phycisphaerae bacterium]|nr:hypothetical protein [Phycisphaerae bacterium]